MIFRKKLTAKVKKKYIDIAPRPEKESPMVSCEWCNASILESNLDKHNKTCNQKPFTEIKDLLKVSHKYCKYCKSEISDVEKLVDHFKTCLGITRENKKSQDVLPFCKYCKEIHEFPITHLQNCSVYLVIKRKINHYINCTEKQKPKSVQCTWCGKPQLDLLSLKRHLENCYRFLKWFYAYNPINTKNKKDAKKIVKAVHKSIAPKVSLNDNQQVLETNQPTNILPNQYDHSTDQQTVVIPAVQQQPIIAQGKACKTEF